MSGSAPEARGFWVWGVDHHDAPLELRERLALPPSRMAELHRALRETPGLAECLVLGTCNRLEFYGAGNAAEGTRGLEVLLANFTGRDAGEWRGFFQLRTDAEAAAHLFEVVSGLDSQMVGETEISGQVKKAYAQAVDQGTAGPWLHRLCQRAFQAGKWARTHTGIQRGRVTEAGVAVELAQRVFGELRDCRVLVLGTGEVARRTMREFAGRMREAPMVAGRDAERTAALADEFGGGRMRLEDALAGLGVFDVVISSTSAPTALIDAETITAARGGHPQRPLFLIDLAVPRDVDPVVAALPDVFLYNLDDLATIANENLELRRREIENCRDVLRRRAHESWETCAGAAPGCGKQTDLTTNVR